jgi:hypothetical protein
MIPESTLIQIYEDPAIGFVDVTNLKLLVETLGAPPTGVMRLSKKAVDRYRKDVNMDYVRLMPAIQRDAPIISLFDVASDTKYLVDGHHRAVRLWDDGVREARTHILPLEFFSTFIHRTRAECKAAAKAHYEHREEQACIERTRATWRSWPSSTLDDLRASLLRASASGNIDDIGFIAPNLRLIMERVLPAIAAGRLVEVGTVSMETIFRVSADAQAAFRAGKLRPSHPVTPILYLQVTDRGDEQATLIAVETVPDRASQTSTVVVVAKRDEENRLGLIGLLTLAPEVDVKRAESSCQLVSVAIRYLCARQGGPSIADSIPRRAQ